MPCVFSFSSLFTNVTSVKINRIIPNLALCPNPLYTLLGLFSPIEGSPSNTLYALLIYNVYLYVYY